MWSANKNNFTSPFYLDSFYFISLLYSTGWNIQYNVEENCERRHPYLVSNVCIFLSLLCILQGQELNLLFLFFFSH